MSKLRVLFVEDDPNDAIIVSRQLHDVADVDVAINAKMFSEMLDEEWDVALVDLHLNDLRGTDVIQRLRVRHPELPIIIVTGSVGAKEADAACNAGAVRFFIKEIDGVPGLARAVAQVHEQSLERIEVMRLKHKATRDQRLEQLGDLSTGIVHDFNNILAVVMMGAEQLRTRINPMDERVLDAIISAANRGAEMTAQVLTFARGSNGTSFKSVSMEYLLSQVGQLVRTTFPPNIRVTIETVPGTNQVKGDETQLVQVLTNLATNARDAMPRGGSLIIRAQNVSRAPVQGPCIVISVMDTGAGIPGESLDKIWEPFFTTKEHGKGTGLGLPTVRRIVESHHGIVTVQSKPGGTMFSIYLPVSIPLTSTEAVLSRESLDGAGRTVLLVDDQKSFLDLATMLLESANYKVLRAANGPEALSQFRAGQQIDVLITDLAMPMMTGDELAMNIRSVGLTLPIVYLSGCDGTQVDDPQPQAVLQKPVTREKLLSTLARILQKPALTTSG